MAISSVRLGSTLDVETVKPSKMETTRPSGTSEAKDTSKATNTGGALLDLPEIQVIPTIPSEPVSRTTKESTGTDSIPPEKPGVTAQKTVAPMEAKEETTATPFVLSDTPGGAAQQTAAPMEAKEEITATPLVLPDTPDGTAQQTAMPMAEIPSTEASPQPVQMPQTALPPVVVPPQVNPFAVYPPGTVVVILPQGGNGAELSQTMPPTGFYGQAQPMMTQPMYWPPSPQLDPLLEQARQIGAIPMPPVIQAGDAMPGNPLLPMPGWDPSSPGGDASNIPTWSQGLYSSILNTYFGGVIPPGGADYTAGLRFA